MVRNRIFILPPDIRDNHHCEITRNGCPSRCPITIFGNKKEIYNGDIVKSTKSKYKRFDDDGIYEVYFNKFLCHYALIASRNKWETKHGQYDNYSLTECKAKEFEVIGNIYENLELLENKQL